MSYEDIIAKVSKEVNLPETVVNNTYRAFWFYIKSHIESLPLKENLTEEEFLKLRTNFNLPSLGKLYSTYYMMTSLKRKLNKNEHKED
nr:MAG TPA: DNA-binding protein [Crassvirales sp.]